MREARLNFTTRLASSALFLATLSEMLLPFIRSIALARLLGIEQFGLGITLSIVYGIVEQTTDIGISFSAVRADGGDHPDRLYATLQTLMATRGALLAAVLIVASPLMAYVFSAPEATIGYALLGVAMMIRGCANLGVKEAMRSYVFWREACVVAGSQTFWTVTTVISAYVFKSFYAVIIGILGNVVSYVALCHVLSPRRLRFGWDKPLAEDAIAFGRPLIPNGIANAFTQLADRFFIGSLIGVAQLAVYNVAMVTALLPRNAIARLLITLFMPVFSNLGLDQAKGARVYDCWILFLSLLGFAYGIALVSIGPETIQLIFGAKFNPSALVMGMIAVNICAKFMDQLPVPAAVALGQTRFIFFGTIVSALGVAFGLVVLFLTKDFDIFIAALAVGEILALLWIVVRTIRLHHLPAARTITFVSLPLLVLAGLVIVRAEVSMSFVSWVALSWATGLATIGVLLCLSWLSGMRIFSLVSEIKNAKTAVPDVSAAAIA